MKTISVLSLVAIALLSAAQLVPAQVPNATLALNIANAQKQNATLMKQYSWTSRMELMENEKVLDIRLDTVNYGPDGALQRTVMNDQGAPLPHGFLRHAIAENKRKETEKYVTGLCKLLDQYSLPTAGKVLDFISGASVQTLPGVGGATQLQMTGSNVVIPGDTFTLGVDPTTMATRSMQIMTTFEGDIVTATATFKTTKSGLTFMAFGEVQVPNKNMSLQLQNFDYQTNQ